MSSGRPVGGTEYSWCKAVPGGTGITVIALLLSKPPDLAILQTALQQFQISNPILNSKLHFDPASNSFSFVNSPNPYIQIQPAQLHTNESTFHLIFEHELNDNPWQTPTPDPIDVFFARVYHLEDDSCVLALRLHTSVCDNTSTQALIKGLSELIQGQGESEGGLRKEIGLGIEEYIPIGQRNKPFWARGMDMLGYSLNSFRLGNLDFQDTASPRMSRVARLQMNQHETTRILSSCEYAKVKLSSLLAAAVLLATRCLKIVPDGQWEKYAVTTLVDCRSILDPVLNTNHIGFYHSAILSTHDLNGGENLLDLAKRVDSSYKSGKNNHKHFTDMADLNFLMCKAIENPALTPSSSLRTSLVSIFEDPIIDSISSHESIGLQDWIACGSIHGIGPSLAMFNTIRDGRLDCTFVYPFPLHSREQMQTLIDQIKQIVFNGTT